MSEVKKLVYIYIYNKMKEKVEKSLFSAHSIWRIARFLPYNYYERKNNCLNKIKKVKKSIDKTNQK